MRIPQPESQRKHRSFEKTIPAPTGGLNSVDPVAAMPASDALVLDNFWPTPVDVALRKGWLEFASIPLDDINGTRHDIRSIMSYTSPAGVSAGFVGDQTGIYDITAGGAVSVISSVATNGEWESVNISTAGGSFLWCCNGVDKARYYNGSAWTVLDGTSTPALLGVTSTTISDVVLFKTRLIFVIKDTLDFAFLPVNSVAGTASVFPLGAILTRGGHIVLVDTWSVDGGSGIDDYLIFMTSEGEVAVYKGTDPAVAANWALVGVYFVGRPLSKRSSVKLGGDLILLTVQGVYPLSKALGYATVDKTSAVSYKIQTLFNRYTELGIDLYGWQVVHYPEATMLLINAPYRASSALNFFYSYQFVMNTTNLAWARFTNMPSEVWGVHDNKLFFAAHDKIYQAWTGTHDGAASIRGIAQQAYSTLGRPSVVKHIKHVRPLIHTDGEITLSLGLETDFSLDSPLQLQEASLSDAALWDIAVWDASRFAGSSVELHWRTVSNRAGRWQSLVIRVDADVKVNWYSTDYIFETGSYL